jgi:N,N-dimethylformamidase
MRHRPGEPDPEEDALIQAYFEEWSRRPGDRVRMAISTAHSEVRAVFERLNKGPGAKGEFRAGAESLEDVLNITIPGRRQNTKVGSYASLPLPSQGLGGRLTIHCWVWPTVPNRSNEQTVWSLDYSNGTVSLTLTNGVFEVRVKGRPQPLVTAQLAAIPQRWYSATVVISEGETTIDVALVDGWAANYRSVAAGPGCGLSRPVCLLLAALETDAHGSPVQPFNGKIERPRIYAGVLTDTERDDLHFRGSCDKQPAASWHFSRDWVSQGIAVDQGHGGSGTIFNGAERGVTGHNWDGTSETFLTAPEQYGALQFHEDDVVDSGWAYDLEFTLPDNLKSGVYAVRLEAGSDVDRHPLFVLAPRGESAPILFLIPSNTYTAYGNNHLAAGDISVCMPHEKVVPEDEQLLFQDPGFGRSVYDTHSDGTPVRYSSRRRPLVDMRPAAFNWQVNSYRHFAADLYLIEWLERVGLPYHIATDEDLDREGQELLGKYKVLVTASHPEYWTLPGYIVLENYLASGGRLLYLGGNGFYWFTSRDPARPWVIEIRRDHSGTRAWNAPYGERMHVNDCELGGMWRLRGKSPNKLVGVGFAAEGWSRACGYKRTQASYTGAGSVFFAGVEDEVIGDHGHVLGGAVADEIDRFDLALGSPAHAEILASSTGVGREYQVVLEDMNITLPEQDGIGRPDLVRADMVYFPIKGGGGVFSVGSIAYAGAMAWNDFDNAAARVATNVLRAFASNFPDL